MINRNSHEAKGYMEDYRNQIKAKFLSNKETKKSLLEALDKEGATPDKEKEINERYKADMKNFVNALKSDEKFARYQEKYHEDIQEIRKLLHDVVSGDDKKWSKREEDRIKKLFPEAKKIAFEWSSHQWNGFVKQFWKSMRKLKKADKEKVLGSLDTIFASKENLQKACKEIINWFKAIDMSDKIESTFMALICLIGTKEFLFGDRVFTILVWLIRVSLSVHRTQEHFKEMFIKNASTNEVEKILQSHQYDHHDDLPIGEAQPKSKIK